MTNVSEFNHVEVTASAVLNPADEPVAVPELPAMRILRIADSGSLSGRSTLTYQLAVDSNSLVHIRLFHNSAKGYFCKDWLSMPAIEALLSEATSFTSGDLQRLCYSGKSVNSGGFLIAALRNEGLIRTSEGSLRSYEALDSTAWQLEILALMESGVALSEHQAPVVAEVAMAKVTGKGRKPKAKPQAATTPLEA
jgi:hypothetical protein